MILLIDLMHMIKVYDVFSCISIYCTYRYVSIVYYLHEYIEISSIDFDGSNLASGDIKGLVNIYQPHSASTGGLGVVLFSNQSHERSVTGVLMWFL